MVFANTYKGANMGAKTLPTAGKRNEKAGRFQISIDVLIISLKGTERDVQEN